MKVEKGRNTYENIDKVIFREREVIMIDERWNEDKVTTLRAPVDRIVEEPCPEPVLDRIINWMRDKV